MNKKKFWIWYVNIQIVISYIYTLLIIQIIFFLMLRNIHLKEISIKLCEYYEINYSNN